MIVVVVAGNDVAIPRLVITVSNGSNWVVIPVPYIGQ